MVPIWVTNEDADALLPVAQQLAISRLGMVEVQQCNPDYWEGPEYLAIAEAVIVCGDRDDIMKAYQVAAIAGLEPGAELKLFRIGKDGKLAEAMTAQTAASVAGNVISENIPAAEVAAALVSAPATAPAATETAPDPPAAAAPPADEDEGTPVTADAPPKDCSFDPKAAIRVLKDRCAACDDIPSLRVWLDLEQSHQKRPSAIDAIQSRIAKLTPT